MATEMTAADISPHGWGNCQNWDRSQAQNTHDPVIHRLSRAARLGSTWCHQRMIKNRKPKYAK